MADIIVDLKALNAGKGYVVTRYQRGRDLIGDELNESFDMERILRRKTIAAGFGEGFFTIGFDILASGIDNEITIEAGNGIAGGEFIRNDSRFNITGLTTPSGGPRTDIVYLRVREIEIDSAADPDILFADIGETTRRIKIETDVIVDEGSTTLPPHTGELDEGGVRYELLGFLNRQDADPTIPSVQIQDARTIIGQVFLNEDKNLELLGGGEVLYNETTGQVDWGLIVPSPDNDMVIFQPSTAGNARIDASDGSHNPFYLPNNGDVAYVNLDRNATSDYNVSILIGTLNSIPNNATAFVIAFRGLDGKLYFRDGTCWDDGQQHLIRINPFTGQIVDADVAPIGVANITGDKIAVASMNADRIYNLPAGVPADMGVISFTGVCPSGYTEFKVGSDDTFFRIAGVGGTTNLTASGSNTHNVPSHNHGFSFSTGVNGGQTNGLSWSWNAFPFGPGLATAVGHGHNGGSVNGSGSTSNTSVNFNHQPKHVQFVLCRKDP